MPWHEEDSLFDWNGPLFPRVYCSRCGSTDIQLGCPYQDCEVCRDVEASTCAECGQHWGGAGYWEDAYHAPNVKKPIIPQKPEAKP